MTELFDGEVRRQTGLPSFFADDTDSDIGRLDHRDIIPAVTNTADPLLCVRPDEFCDVGLLSWGASTGNDSGE